MQLITVKIQELWAENPILLGGYLLILLLCLQAFTVLTGSVRRGRFQMQRQSIELERMRMQLDRTRSIERETNVTHWNGFRKFSVARKVLECEDVCSFYLHPHDGRPLPSFRPGQYLTFQLKIPNQPKPLIRCYSLSDSPDHPEYYRVTIKRCHPPKDVPDAKPGLSSSYFLDEVEEGDILDVKAPGGGFFLDMDREMPIVLISGGVGITPMLSMVNAVVGAGSQREIWFFHGARNSEDHIMKEAMEELAAKHANVKLHVCYSRPLAADKPGRDYLHNERVSVELFKRMLPSNNFDYYMCGPGPMMSSVVEGLEQWGVPDKHIFYEAFGPATVKKKAPAAVAVSDGKIEVIEVVFSRSEVSCKWGASCESLLDLADDDGVTVDAGCRAGNCGTCLVAIKSGEVEYLSEPGSAVEEGSCLTCISRPISNLVLDA